MIILIAIVVVCCYNEFIMKVEVKVFLIAVIIISICCFFFLATY